MAKERKLLRKGEVVYTIVVMWVVLGTLVGALCFMPSAMTFEDSMARVAYGLVCFVTVCAGLFAWYQLKEYIDIIYERYVVRTKEKWAEVDAKRGYKT